MSSTKATSVNYSVRPFFGFILRQNWQHLALYTILALLAMFVPCLLTFAEGIPDFYGYDSVEQYILSQLGTINSISVILSGAIGIFAGMSAVGYINNKAHVGCWHSFPVSRTKMYLIETGTRGIYFAISILIGYLSSYLLAGMFFGFGIPGMFGLMLTGLMRAACCFLIVCSVTLLAAGLCGTAPMRFIMLCIISFLPVALYSLFVYLFSEGMSVNGINLYETFYLKANFLEVICLPYRVFVFTGLEDNYPVQQCLWLIPEAVIYYIGGLLLHKYRKSEATGTTIVWKPVFTAVKYVILFTCGLSGMFLIGSDYVTGNSSFLRVILGTLIGLIIAFMVMNAILYKSSRAMFRGIKPFLACAAVTLAFILLIPVNVTGLIGKDYSASSLKRLEIGTYGLEFTDPDDIDTLMALMAENEKVQLPAQNNYLTMDGDSEYLKTWFPSASDPENWSSKYYEETGLEPAPAYNRWIDSIRVVEYPKFGIPFARMIEIDRNGSFWKTIRLSKEYHELYNIADYTADEIREITITVGEESLYLYRLEDEHEIVSVDYGDDKAAAEYYNATLSEDEVTVRYTDSTWNAPAAAILEHCVLPEGYSDYPIVGIVSIMSKDADGYIRSKYYPVYADNVDLINEFGWQIAEARERYNVQAQKAVTADTPEDVVAMLIPDDTRSILVNYETSEAKKLTAEELRVLLLDTVSIQRVRNWNSQSNSTASTVPYAIYISNGRDSSHMEIRFRDGALTGEELVEIFASLD